MSDYTDGSQHRSFREILAAARVQFSPELAAEASAFIGADPMSVSEAVIQLRRAYGKTQQKFSDLVGVTVRTIARWEVETPPSIPLALEKLRSLALEIGRADLAEVFLQALPRTNQEIRRSIGLEVMGIVLEASGKDGIVAALMRYFDEG